MLLSDRARRFFLEKPAAMSAVIVDSACRVFRLKAMLCRVERDVCQYFGQHKFFQRYGRWTQLTNWAPVLADVVFLAGF